MDRLSFARRIAGWLVLACGVVWVSGPAAMLVVPYRTGCLAGVISCEALAGAIQAAAAVLAGALLALVLLRLCRRRILDAGFSGTWVLFGTVPSLLVCREITSGALTADALHALVDAWPAPAMGPPLHLFAALAVAGVIGLLPAARKSATGAV